GPAAGTAPAPPAQCRYPHGEADGDRVVHHVRRPPEPATKHGVVRDHLAGNVAENPSAEPDDPYVSGHEARQDAASPDDDGQRQADAEQHEDEVAVGGGGDG